MNEGSDSAAGNSLAGNALYIVPLAAMLAGVALMLSPLWLHNPYLGFVQPVGACLALSAVYLPFHMQRLEAGSFTNLGLLAIWLTSLLLGLAIGVSLALALVSTPSGQAGLPSPQNSASKSR